MISKRCSGPFLSSSLDQNDEFRAQNFGRSLAIRETDTMKNTFDKANYRFSLSVLCYIILTIRLKDDETSTSYKN